MGDYEVAKQLMIEAFNAVGINPTINPELYDCTTGQNGVSEYQILDETENEHEYQGEEKGGEIGYLKQQLPKEEEPITFKLTTNVWRPLEGKDLKEHERKFKEIWASLG